MIYFNADEVFTMAQQIERNGAGFYRAAAESADGAQRDLLLRLAAAEDDHEQTFAAMRFALSDAERRPLTFDPDNESARYLKEMADGKVFEADPSKALTGDETPEEILNVAIGKEKDSIVFYESAKGVVTSASGKSKLDTIIRQEIGHIVDITAQLRALNQ